MQFAKGGSFICGRWSPNFNLEEEGEKKESSVEIHINFCLGIPLSFYGDNN